jgi:mannose-6-phosphate isomerase-like protein (cupin superfamily)
MSEQATKLNPFESRKNSYGIWLESEGIPLHEEVAGFEDVTAVPRKRWERVGGDVAFLQLVGTRQAQRGLYVCEIPAGDALKTERHLYEKAIYIIKGRGFTEVWQGDGPKQKFEWGPGSLFAIPLNASHRMVNGTREPALFFAETTAPQIMGAFAESDFEAIFNSDYKFKTRWDGKKDYFAATENRQRTDQESYIIGTNFIPDLKALFLDDLEKKVAGGQITGYRMGRFPRGHVSEWPVGRYHAAHYHGPGAILFGLRAEGYVLVWPNEAGPHPYESGYGDKVLKIKWKENSVYSPPDRWYHQHFNTGNEPARHFAIYGQMEFGDFATPTLGFKGLVDSREGGTLVSYEQEDPEMRKMFERELAKKGMKSTMPQFNYARNVA